MRRPHSAPTRKSSRDSPGESLTLTRTLTLTLTLTVTVTSEYGGNYGPPSGFNWDVSANDEPVQDDPRLTHYNVKSRVDDFVAAATALSNMTQGEHVMFTMGSDFQYEAAGNWFVNLDAIIHHVNLDGRVNAFYSSPSAYVAAKRAEAAVAWPLKTDDFFPYADGPHQFWTGYFTSRPAWKRMVRSASAAFQSLRQLGALGGSAAQPDLAQLEQALALAQHHDAVTGTAKQHVTFDYARRLAAGLAAAHAAALPGLSVLVGAAAAAPASWSVCPLANVSICAPTQTLAAGAGQLHVAVYNSLAQPLDTVVELPIGASRLKLVAGPAASAAGPSSVQIVPSLPPVTNYATADPAAARRTALFRARVPPLGHALYTFTATADQTDEQPAKAQQPAKAPEHSAAAAAVAAAAAGSAAGSAVTIENEALSLTFDATGALASISNKAAKLTTPLTQVFGYYRASEGSKASGGGGQGSGGRGQASGAYVFRPNASNCFATGAPRITRVVGGDAVATGGALVQEVRVRLWANPNLNPNPNPNQACSCRKSRRPSALGSRSVCGSRRARATPSSRTRSGRSRSTMATRRQRGKRCGGASMDKAEAGTSLLSLCIRS